MVRGAVCQVMYFEKEKYNEHIQRDMK